ncbi:MAG: class I SAM-dependent methyltransferase [Oligoflexia bacterium]|nr:class I SAM-dependent methyltransferase [Oligoflexia bacterium]
MKVYRCKSCDLLYLFPMMSDAATQRLYNHYTNYVFMRGLGDETPLQTFVRRKPLAATRLERLKCFLDSNKAVLEVGGGCGNVIGEIKRQKLASCSVIVEICHEQLEFAKKEYDLETYLSLSDIQEKKSFDFIFLFHVLEHINEPIAFLKNIYQLLKNDGLVFFEVPSSSDPLISLYNIDSFKDFYFQVQHPYVYSEKSLRQLVDSSEFSIVEFRYHQRYSFLNHLKWLNGEKQRTCN